LFQKFDDIWLNVAVDASLYGHRETEKPWISELVESAQQKKPP
jgi:hypothetical protein